MRALKKKIFCLTWNFKWKNYHIFHINLWGKCFSDYRNTRQQHALPSSALLSHPSAILNRHARSTISGWRIESFIQPRRDSASSSSVMITAATRDLSGMMFLWLRRVSFHMNSVTASCFLHLGLESCTTLFYSELQRYYNILYNRNLSGGLFAHSSTYITSHSPKK